jgi:mRNA-degrading endonuclease RelE of RelBE toxin-antitoxin system
MAYTIKSIPQFDREAKRLTKKYFSLKQELEDLYKELEKEPTSGIPLGDNVFKIRLAIASKGKGKSGGARVITYVVVDDETVLLLSIYDKSKKDTISDKEILQLLISSMKAEE